MKKLITSLVLLFSFSTVFSQTFMHGAGVSLMVSSSHGDISLVDGLTYSLRLNFVENEKLSVSVGIPLSVAISASISSSTYDPYSGYYSGGSSVGIVINVPLLVSLNMGRGSTKINRDKFGWFVGAGPAFYHGDFIDDYTASNTFSVNTFGPAGNAGMRFGVGRRHKNIEVRFSFMKGLTNYKTDLYGVACLFNF